MRLTCDDVAKDYVPAAADNVLGVVGYVDEWANYVDLEASAKNISLPSFMLT